MHWATQEDDDDTMERRQSLGTQRSEQALDPGMAAHVVDALFDRCATAPARFDSCLGWRCMDGGGRQSPEELTPGAPGGMQARSRHGEIGK